MTNTGISPTPQKPLYRGCGGGGCVKSFLQGSNESLCPPEAPPETLYPRGAPAGPRSPRSTARKVPREAPAEHAKTCGGGGCVKSPLQGTNESLRPPEAPPETLYPRGAPAGPRSPRSTARKVPRVAPAEHANPRHPHEGIVVYTALSKRSARLFLCVCLFLFLRRSSHR